MADLVLPHIAQVDLHASGFQNAQISPRTRIGAGKILHRRAITVELFDETTEVTATPNSRLLVIFKNAATLIRCQAVVATDATGADRVLSVGMSHSDQGAAFAGGMIPDLTFTDTTGDRTAVETTSFSPSSMTAGDIVRMDWAVAGSAGSQAVGLTFSLTWDEVGG